MARPLPISRNRTRAAASDSGNEHNLYPMSSAPFISTPQTQRWELEFALMAMALALVFAGGGRLALDRYLGS